MKSEIEISEIELKFIVEDEFDMIMELAKLNSFCVKCNRKGKVEMKVDRIVLGDLNDIIFKGICKTCNGRMARYVEIGEQSEYRLRTEIIRRNKTHIN